MSVVRADLKDSYFLHIFVSLFFCLFARTWKSFIQCTIKIKYVQIYHAKVDQRDEVSSLKGHK